MQASIAIWDPILAQIPCGQVQHTLYAAHARHRCNSHNSCMLRHPFMEGMGSRHGMTDEKVPSYMDSALCRANIEFRGT